LRVHNYQTTSGKDLIYDYIDKLSTDEKTDGYSVIENIVNDKMDELTIKQWQGKIHEVYFYRHNRIFYVTIEDTDVYLLHACRKQKNKTEKRDSRIVIQRAKELGYKLSRKFI
jgi:phage-related protein